jgi:hypothetical protein
MSTEFGQRVFGIAAEAVAPGFCFAEDPFVRLWPSIQRVDRNSNRFGIYPAHELANELFLASQRTVRIGRPRQAYGVDQLRLSDNCGQLRVRQLNERFTQDLQFTELSFECALAGL